jgi:hypothetical protein
MGELNSGATLTAGQSRTSPSGRYVLVMQTNGLLVLLDTSTNPATVIFSSPNTAQNPPQSNIVCLMATNGILQVKLGATILSASTNPVSLRAALFVEDSGIAAIMKNGVNAPANDLWDTTQSMALPPGHAAVFSENEDGSGLIVRRTG